MKIFFYLIIASILFTACSQSDDILDSIVNENSSDSIIIIGINLTGDIALEESILTRSETESTDLIGIQVYKNGAYYCYGLFDCMQDVKIALKAGYSYKFECTEIKDGKELLFNDRDYHYTGSPFGLGVYNRWNGCDNSFHYNSSMGMEDLHSNGITPKGVSWYTKVGYCKPFDRFYGEVTDYTPTVDGVLDLPLKRVSFGLKVKVSGITDGSVSVTCKNNYNTFYSNSNITSNIESEGQLFSMYNIYDAWQYADADYQEAVELSVVWTRGNGIVQNLGTKTAYVKRNVMNIIKVRLSKNDTDVDVDVDPEEGDMGGEEEDLSN